MNVIPKQISDIKFLQALQIENAFQMLFRVGANCKALHFKTLSAERSCQRPAASVRGIKADLPAPCRPPDPRFFRKAGFADKLSTPPETSTVTVR